MITYRCWVRVCGVCDERTHALHKECNDMMVMVLVVCVCVAGGHQGDSEGVAVTGGSEVAVGDDAPCWPAKCGLQKDLS